MFGFQAQVGVSCSMDLPLADPRSTTGLLVPRHFATRWTVRRLHRRVIPRPGGAGEGEAIDSGILDGLWSNTALRCTVLDGAFPERSAEPSSEIALLLSGTPSSVVDQVRLLQANPCLFPRLAQILRGVVAAPLESGPAVIFPVTALRALHAALSLAFPCLTSIGIRLHPCTFLDFYNSLHLSQNAFPHPSPCRQLPTSPTRR